MSSFTPVPSLIGGALIGAAAAAMLLLNGQIAGVSGIFGGLLRDRRPGDVSWRALFVAGLVAGGVLMAFVRPGSFAAFVPRSALSLAAAGLLVGVGASMANGCTSGHGVCGVGRFAPRSIVATMTFMFTGAATVFVVHHLVGA